MNWRYCMAGPPLDSQVFLLFTGGHPGSDSQFRMSVKKDSDGTAFFSKTFLAKNSTENNSWFSSQSVKDTKRKLYGWSNFDHKIKFAGNEQGNEKLEEVKYFVKPVWGTVWLYFSLSGLDLIYKKCIRPLNLLKSFGLYPFYLDWSPRDWIHKVKTDWLAKIHI